jgi:hypothetical protein
MNTLIFIQMDVKSRRLGGATQPLGLRWDFDTASNIVHCRYQRFSSKRCIFLPFIGPLTSLEISMFA